MEGVVTVEEREGEGGGEGEAEAEGEGEKSRSGTVSDRGETKPEDSEALMLL